MTQSGSVKPSRCAPYAAERDGEMLPRSSLTSRADRAVESGVGGTLASICVAVRAARPFASPLVGQARSVELDTVADVTWSLAVVSARVV